MHKYAQQTGLYDHLIKKEKKKLFSVNGLRLAFFILTVFLLYFYLTRQFTIYGIGAFIFFVSFLFLVRATAKLERQISHYKKLLKQYMDDWNLKKGIFPDYDDGKSFLNSEHAFAADLDLFGEHSLFHRINRLTRKNSVALLASRMMNPFHSVEEIKQQQEAINELAQNETFRRNYIAYGMFDPDSNADVHTSSIIGWLETEDKQPLGFKILSLVFPIVFLLLVLANVMLGWSAYLWQMMLVINLGVAALSMKRINKQHNLLSHASSTLKRISKQLLQIEYSTFKSVHLKKMQDSLSQDKQPSIVLDQLSKLIRSFDSRLNLIVALFLNGVFLWDLHLENRLIKWKENNKEKVKGWFDVVDEFEVVCCLGNYAANNPSYTYPDVSCDVILGARQLGHPFIDESKMVTNHIEIEKGKFLIVTGANMAGKSTLLRSVGISLAMAMTGLPVCAGKIKMRPVQLFSSMRTTDSLDKNESYFYAELKRLKTLKEIAKGEIPVFVLLDEILKGTNSADKQKGSIIFIEKLLSAKLTGMLATHDLEITRLAGEHPGQVENKCFEIYIEEDKMKFDYKLHEGVTKNMNALLLMKNMGLISDWS